MPEPKAKIIYQDKRVVVAIKPAGICSTDEPGGMPDQIRALLRSPQGCVRTVHRLDQVVGGLMVFARSVYASKVLSEQVRCNVFAKQYWAVVHGILPGLCGRFEDLLYRDRKLRKTEVVSEPGEQVKHAVLDYQVLETCGAFSLVEITLQTGRTHQIRAQFSHHGHPLVGDRKYGAPDEPGPVALWSCRIGFNHPESNRWMDFVSLPPHSSPWTLFSALNENCEVLDIADDSGQPTGQTVRRDMAHRNGIQHRTSHVWILRRQQGRVQVLLQKRSDEKDSFPGCYDISSAGHIPAGCEFIASALRELEEELGYRANAEELIFCGQRRFSFRQTFHGMPFYDKQVSNIYALWADREPEQFHLQTSEVSEVRWFDFSRCLDMVRNNSFPHCIYPEELEMLQKTLQI